MSSPRDYRDEDVGNIALMDHINLQVVDQQTAVLFYVAGLGFTRDPYMTVGVEHMWINVGKQQFHLPARGKPEQVIPGHIGIVISNLELLQGRLKAVQESLKGSKFAWSIEDDHVSVTCPWGNHFRCYEPATRFGDMALGIAYIEFLVKPDAAGGIARFYQQAMRAPSVVESENGVAVARVEIGHNQKLLFRETEEEIPPYDGHHIAVYVTNFSDPYEFLIRRHLIMEDVKGHQFRFKQMVDPENGKEVFQLEHEVRSLRHPMFLRPLVNRNPAQTNRQYLPGNDSLIPVGAAELSRHRDL